MPETKLNVYQRLLEVRKSVSYLKKDSDNIGQKFKFVSSSQTLAAVREVMNDQGLMLIPKVEDFEVRNHSTSSGANWYFTILKMEFEWINTEHPEDRFTCKWTGQGLDNGEKGVGKALTYAEKYFILKTFNIPTDKDDPDAFEQKHDKNGRSKTTAKQPPKATPKDSPDEEVERIDTVAKIIKNATAITELHCDSNTTAADKNKMHAEIITQWTTYGDLPNAKGNAGLMKFTIKRLRAVYGTSKKEVANIEAVPEPAAADVGDGQEGLPF